MTEIRSASRVHKEEWQASGVPFYRSSDVMAALNGTKNEKAFISEELYEKLSAVSGKLEKGDVLVTGGGSVGKPYIVPNNEPLYTKDADLLWIKNNNDLDPYFIYTFFFSPSFMDYLSSVSHVGTIAHYTITQLGETPITLPNVSEQQRIGLFFQNLDNLITLHQREYFSFDFNGESAKTAQNTLSWEQRKVGDVLSESRDAGHSGDIAKKLTVKLWGKGVYAKDDKGSAATQYFTRHAGQFIYSKLDFLNSAFGVVSQELESYESTADLPAFDCVGVEPYFMFYRAIQPSFYLTNGMIADGSRKAKRIHVETFLDMPLDLPSIEEQQKVASYFIQLDSLITLHQREYFPFSFDCESAKTAQKTISWEQRKLSDTLNFLSNNTLSRAELSEDTGTYKNVHYGDVLIKFGEYIDAQSTDLPYIADDEKAKKFESSKLQDGDIIIADTAEDEAVGKCVEIGNIGDLSIVSGLHTIPCRPKVKFAPAYLGFYLNSASYHDQLIPLMQGIKVTSISKSAISDTMISAPTNLSEQGKIGQFFTQLDSLITLHQHKPDKKRTRRFNRHAL